MISLTRHALFHDPAYPSSERLDDGQRALVAEFNRGAADGSIAFHKAEKCLCGGTRFDTVSTYDRYRIWQPIMLCRSCGLLFCQPRMADDTINWFYSSDVYRCLYNSTLLPHTSEAFMKQASRSTRRHDTIRKMAVYDHIKTVGEIGCGAGWNLWWFHQDGKKVIGTDYSPGLTEAGRGIGMDIRTGTMDQLSGERFDVLLIPHVLEHMPDPLAALQGAAKLLAEDGLLHVEVPDARDVCLGMLQSAHLWYFTPKRLQHLAAQAGLVPVAEESYGGVHFSITFRRQENAPLPDLSGEYAIMRDIILRFERRERFKDMLKRLGLFSLGRKVHSLLRR